jgi:hypothetical protein
MANSFGRLQKQRLQAHSSCGGLKKHCALHEAFLTRFFVALLIEHLTMQTLGRHQIRFSTPEF